MSRYIKVDNCLKCPFVLITPTTRWCDYYLNEGMNVTDNINNIHPDCILSDKESIIKEGEL